MNVTYIAHSGFILETETAYFLFDYYTGKIPAMNAEKDIVVFVSHSHSDHYNPAIWELQMTYPNIHYVLWKRILTNKHAEELHTKGIDTERNVTLVRRNLEYTITLSDGNMLGIETLASTDQGVAYLLNYKKQTFYHAGDLNCWMWEGETKQYNNNMKANYLREMTKLNDKRIDVAFVPLDTRQHQYAYLGLELFLEHAQCNCVFPMHFWEDFSIIPAFIKDHPAYADAIMPVTRNGQTFYM